MDSILLSIKKLLGIASDYKQFDTDVIIHINSVFLTLNQLGIGPDDGFSIDSESEEWSDYIPDNQLLLSAVISYMYLKVKMLFDPSLTSFVNDLMKEEARELEWRMNLLADEPEFLREGKTSESASL